MCSAQTHITKDFNHPSIGDVVNNYIVIGTVDNSATGTNATFLNSGLTQGAATINAYTAPNAGEMITLS